MYVYVQFHFVFSFCYIVGKKKKKHSKKKKLRKVAKVLSNANMVFLNMKFMRAFFVWLFVVSLRYHQKKKKKSSHGGPVQLSEVCILVTGYNASNPAFFQRDCYDTFFDYVTRSKDG